MANRLFQHLGNYRVEHLLGSGGFAEVYLGTHVHVGTQAAIKVLHSQFATPPELEKFRAEAQTLVTLQHPHIVRMLDFGVEEGTPYLVMDYAPNGSLRQRLPAETPLPPSTIVPYLVQVAEALQYAHERQLVHRDVKPENMLLGKDHQVLLTDFGIATVAQHTSQQRTEGVAGTAAYMAPEQLQGKSRPASDLYALGIVVYEWLCGERPFVGGPMEVATQQMFSPPPLLREKVPSLSPAIEQVVLTALAKDPKERFGNVCAFANAFQQACREAGMVYVTSRPLLLPLSPAPMPLPLQSDQESAPASNAQAPAGMVPGGQVDQAGAALSGATIHLTPRFTPLSTTSPQPWPVGQKGGSPSQAPTGLFTPDPTLVVPGPDTPAMDSRAAGTEEPAVQRDVPTLVASPLAPGARGGDATKGRRRGGVQRWTLVAAACLLLLALLGGGAVYGLPVLLHPYSNAQSVTTAATVTITPSSNAQSVATAATVTITPAKSDLSNTFNLTAVTGTPDASQQQVGARVLSTTTSAHSKTVSATGQQSTPGTHATGQVVVNNYDTVNPLNFPAGSTFSKTYGCTASGLIMVLDAPVSLAPAPSGGKTYTIIPGHIQQVGSIGNFTNCEGWNIFGPANCPGSSAGASLCWVIASRGDFTGGTDPQPYTAVQQSDIDGAAHSLIQANQPNAQQVVQGQLQQGEQLVGTPQCQPNTSADHKAGDQASTVTVSVSFTCTGEAYDQAGALAMVKQLLTSQAATTPGAGYALVGQIKATLVSATPDNQGMVAIVVQAEGIWVYQFSTAQKQALAQLIAGKSQQEAQQLLAAQPGVAQVQMTLTAGNGQALPTDPQQITILIQTVPGL
jgi:serine/threonine protein kinase